MPGQRRGGVQSVHQSVEIVWWLQDAAEQSVRQKTSGPDVVNGGTVTTGAGTVNGAGTTENAECCSSIRPVDRVESALASYGNTSRASTFCTTTIVEARAGVVEVVVRPVS